MEDLHYLSLREASIGMRDLKISPVAVVEACLKRIESLNNDTNAFITVLGDGALKEAAQAESEIKAGHWRGPLHGIPVGLKDMYDTAGIRTTAAFKHFKDRIPIMMPPSSEASNRPAPSLSERRTCMNWQWAQHPAQAISGRFVTHGILSISPEDHPEAQPPP